MNKLDICMKCKHYGSSCLSAHIFGDECNIHCQFDKNEIEQLKNQITVLEQKRKDDAERYLKMLVSIEFEGCGCFQKEEGACPSCDNGGSSHDTLCQLSIDIEHFKVIVEGK